MSDLLAIGASGLRSNRAALDAVGDNVANAQTEGYARRSVRIAEVRIDSGPSVLYRNRIRFDGSIPADVVRASDAFRTLEARVTSADASAASAASRWLATAETALGGDRVGTSLATMFANGERLAADPTGAQPRRAFLDGVADVASDIRTTAVDLARVADGVGQAASTDVADANAALAGLAKVNLMIRRQQPGTAAFAELEDQRDQLIDGLAAKLGATAAVSADGSVKITSGTTTLLDLGTVTPLSVTIASDGRLSYAAGATPLTPTTGSLSGLAGAADTIADRRASVDTLAGDVANAVNNWQADGTTPDGRAGPPLLAISAGATSLALATTDPAAVATATGGSANGNVLALSSVRSASAVEAAAALVVSTQASATAAAKSAETLTGKRRDTAAGARDQVEGVDLDREAADLLRYQQAYQASSRVVQVARDTVDAILALFR